MKSGQMVVNSWYFSKVNYIFFLYGLGQEGSAGIQGIFLFAFLLMLVFLNVESGVEFFSRIPGLIFNPFHVILWQWIERYDRKECDVDLGLLEGLICVPLRRISPHHQLQHKTDYYKIYSPDLLKTWYICWVGWYHGWYDTSFVLA